MESAAGRRLTLGALLAALALLGLHRSRQQSAVFDEVAHIGAGYAYAAAGDYRMNPEHPPLVKLLAGAAAATLPVSDVLSTPAFAGGDQWRFGEVLLDHPAAAGFALLDRARLPMIALGVLGGWLLYRLVTILHGRTAALLALALYAGTPEITGHMVLVTTDAPMATFGLGAVLMALKLRRRFTPWRATWLAVFLAAAHMTKFNAVVLWPMVLLVLVFPGTGRLGLSRVLQTVAHGLAATVALGLLVYQGPRAFTLFPAGFWHAFSRDLADPTFPFYLLGRFSQDGFWSYFVVALGLKMPVPLVLLVLWAVASLAVRRPALPEVLAVLAPAAAWLLFTSALAANIGSRYALPALPFLLALAARPARTGHGVATALALGLGVATVFSGVRTPDAIGYTNALVPRGRALAYFDMSCVDWGQGLRLLLDHLDEHPSEGGAPVIVLAQETPPAAPQLLGHAVLEPPLGATFDPSGPGMRPGRYAVGAHHLLRNPELRRRLAATCVVEAGIGASMVVACCPPCGPAAPEDVVLRMPLPEPPRRVDLR